jgi:hypothetical protein
MELNGFELRCGYILQAGGKEYDLHNNFKLASVNYDLSHASASIKLQRSLGSWVPEDTPAEITLVFEEVSRFLQKTGDTGDASGATTIDFIGFLYPDDETMAGFLDDLIDPSQDLIIGMVNETAFKVHARRVTIAVNA